MISAEQKLQLVHFIKEEHKKNRIQLNRREQILYGKNAPEPYVEASEGIVNTNEFDSYKEKGISGFRVRFMISVILFLSFFYFDKNSEKIGNVDMKQIENYIEDDSLECMVSNLFDFNE